MKRSLLTVLLLSGLASCSEPVTEKAALPNAPAVVTPPVSVLSVQHPFSVGRVDTVDHFFYTNQHYKRVGELNQLDMFKLDSGKVLSVCGKPVAGLHYKLGSTVEAFLAQNLTQTAGLNLGDLRLIAWSSDLRGDDEHFFFFKQGRLQQVKGQNAPDLEQLRRTW